MQELLRGDRVRQWACWVPEKAGSEDRAELGAAPAGWVELCVLLRCFFDHLHLVTAVVFHLLRAGVGICRKEQGGDVPTPSRGVKRDPGGRGGGSQ